MRCSTNIYLTALAIADIVNLLFVFILSLKHYPNSRLARYKLYWSFFGLSHWFHDASRKRISFFFFLLFFYVWIVIFTSKFTTFRRNMIIIINKFILFNHSYFFSFHSCPTTTTMDIGQCNNYTDNQFFVHNLCFFFFLSCRLIMCSLHINLFDSQFYTRAIYLRMSSVTRSSFMYWITSQTSYFR